MKLNKTLLTLIIAALLPNLAFASMETAGFKSGAQCSPSTNTVVITDMSKIADQMEQAIDALVNGTTDPVLASYYRDLYRASPSIHNEWFPRSPDPYVDALNIAFYGSTDPGSRQVC